MAIRLAQAGIAKARSESGMGRADVVALADAHLRALESLLADGPNRVLHCGDSVRDVLATVARVSGRTLAIDGATTPWRRSGGGR